MIAVWVRKLLSPRLETFVVKLEHFPEDTRDEIDKTSVHALEMLPLGRKGEGSSSKLNVGIVGPTWERVKKIRELLRGKGPLVLYEISAEDFQRVVQKFYG